MIRIDDIAERRVKTKMQDIEAAIVIRGERLGRAQDPARAACQGALLRMVRRIRSLGLAGLSRRLRNSA